jgi:hypothetical protein
MFSEYIMFSVHIHYKTIYACTLFACTCSSKYDTVFGFWEHNTHLILDSIYPRNITKIIQCENFKKMNDMMYNTCTHVSV